MKKKESVVKVPAKQLKPDPVCMKVRFHTKYNAEEEKGIGAKWEGIDDQGREVIVTNTPSRSGVIFVDGKQRFMAAESNPARLIDWMSRMRNNLTIWIEVIE